jgi:hypothetical protein
MQAAVEVLALFAECKVLAIQVTLTYADVC